VLAVAGAVAAAAWSWRRVRAARVDLRGQVALVTGGSRGLGFLIARELLREGCRVAICARSEPELARARHELAAAGGDVIAIACDVANVARVERAAADVVARWGRLDILINDAGIIEVGPLGALTLADFHQTMDVNFWGTVYASLAVLPHMRARSGGRIVNITSIGGKVAVPHLLAYDAAKFAALGFSEGLRAEVARDGVSVTTVVPGLMRTGGHRFAAFRGNLRAERFWFSLAARLPGLAMSAPRAARRIVRAAKLRDPEVVIGLPAKALRALKEAAPGLTLRALSAANLLLPT
jgi:NAD(P)-dependent dehydrogenase (short-subunit alcohol dehydrogenase family)